MSKRFFGNRYLTIDSQGNARLLLQDSDVHRNGKICSFGRSVPCLSSRKHDSFQLTRDCFCYDCMKWLNLRAELRTQVHTDKGPVWNPSSQNGNSSFQAFSVESKAYIKHYCFYFYIQRCKEQSSGCGGFQNSILAYFLTLVLWLPVSVPHHAFTVWFCIYERQGQGLETGWKGGLGRQGSDFSTDPTLANVA